MYDIKRELYKYGIIILFAVVWLRRYLAKSMGILFEDLPECLLDEVSFEGIARYIASDKCNKIVVMTGAGISTCMFMVSFLLNVSKCVVFYKRSDDGGDDDDDDDVFTELF